MECDFVVGQKIVCIKKADEWHVTWTQINYTLPVYNGQYTIKELVIHPFELLTTKERVTRVSVLLNEIRNPPRFSIAKEEAFELGFPFYYFRPLNEKKIEQQTGISLLKQFERPLIKSKEKENV